MKVFVTGGAGYIGSVVSEVLLNSGHDVVVFDSFETGHRAAVDPRAALMEGDTRDAGGVGEAMLSAAPDVVVHMAAYIQMGESMLDPGKYFRNNTANTLNVLDAMLAAGVSHFVFSSTAGIYGTPESLPIEEDHPIDPLNPYSESKRQVESIIRWYAQAHGGNDGGDTESEAGTAGNDAGNDGNDGGGNVTLYNIGSEHGATNLEVIEMARRVTGRPIPVRECPRRPGDAPASLASAGKIRSELGWEPAASDLETIIGSAWDWLQRHPHGYGHSAD